VTEVPGLTPKSPEMALAPVLVTVEAPRTAKRTAEPRKGLCEDSCASVVDDRSNEAANPRLAERSNDLKCI
jgi:hypothetical protein